MTIRVKFTDAESAAIAWRHYNKPKPQKEWKKYHRSFILGIFIGALVSTSSTPLVPRLIILAGAIVFGYLLGWAFKSLGMKSNVRKYVRELAKTDAYALTVKPEGLEYRCKDVVATYGWSSFSKVEQTEDGFVIALMGEHEWVVPPGSFRSSEERSQFAAAIEAYSQGKQPASTWWTQGESIISPSQIQQKNN